MFEEEAEDYGHEHCCDSCKNLQARYRKVFKDGAEFGYNKANEWQYPSKGEYPKEYKDILICFLTEDDMKNCVRGWYEYDLDEDEHYFKTVNTFGTAVIKNVYAWKELVLPKESK